VHEAFLRLVDQRRVNWQNRAHFLAVAARTMRRILVDHARRQSAAKRDGGAKVTLHEELSAPDRELVDVLALEEALARLEAIDQRAFRVVELRFYGGLEVEEVAVVLEVSEATVKRDWHFAKAWLARELTATPNPGEAGGG
jgi:RNA polymerase sigma factor (TIGR02999 family)